MRVIVDIEISKPLILRIEDGVIIHSQLATYKMLWHGSNIPYPFPFVLKNRSYHHLSNIDTDTNNYELIMDLDRKLSIENL